MDCHIYDVVKICVHSCWVYNWRGTAMSVGVHIFSFRRCGQIASQSVVLIPLRVLHPRAISWIRRMGKRLLLCFFCVFFFFFFFFCKVKWKPCVCVCVCVCDWEGEKEEKGKEKLNLRLIFRIWKFILPKFSMLLYAFAVWRLLLLRERRSLCLLSPTSSSLFKPKGKEVLIWARQWLRLACIS